MACVWYNDILISGGRDCNILSWSVGEEAYTGAIHAAHADWINALAVNASSGLLASSGNDFKVKLWSLQGNVLPKIPMREFVGHTGAVVSLRFLSADLLVSASSDSTCKVWHAHKGHEVTTLYAHNTRVLSLAVMSNDEELAMGCDDGTVYLFRPLIGHQIATLTGYEHIVKRII